MNLLKAWVHAFLLIKPLREINVLSAVMLENLLQVQVYATGIADKYWVSIIKLNI